MSLYLATESDSPQSFGYKLPDNQESGANLLHAMEHAVALIEKQCILKTVGAGQYTTRLFCEIADEGQRSLLGDVLKLIAKTQGEYVVYTRGSGLIKSDTDAHRGKTHFAILIRKYLDIGFATHRIFQLTEMISEFSVQFSQMTGGNVDILILPHQANTSKQILANLKKEIQPPSEEMCKATWKHVLEIALPHMTILQLYQDRNPNPICIGIYHDPKAHNRLTASPFEASRLCPVMIDKQYPELTKVLVPNAPYLSPLSDYILPLQDNSQLEEKIHLFFPEKIARMIRILCLSEPLTSVERIRGLLGDIDTTLMNLVKSKKIHIDHASTGIIPNLLPAFLLNMPIFVQIIYYMPFFASLFPNLNKTALFEYQTIEAIHSSLFSIPAKTYELEQGQKRVDLDELLQPFTTYCAGHSANISNRLFPMNESPDVNDSCSWKISKENLNLLLHLFDIQGPYA